MEIEFLLNLMKQSSIFVINSKCYGFLFNKIRVDRDAFENKKRNSIKENTSKLESDRDDVVALDNDVYVMLDNRRERHLKGESKSYSWKEVKKNIDQHRGQYIKNNFLKSF
ncbi:hypothetical protein [Flavobacterium sp. ZT3R18]|uniref:hypothetical protein n=1 Tax=Flavobacterium sp. ZT3R18 TaxID=2594429 RepID=UPI00163D9700|nr:hypothetical protein [Flavobacterium sp. ZT3R18]